MAAGRDDTEKFLAQLQKPYITSTNLAFDSLKTFGFPALGLIFSGVLLITPIRLTSEINATAITLTAVLISTVSVAAGLFSYLQANRSQHSLLNDELFLADMRSKIDDLRRDQDAGIITLSNEEREQIVADIKASMGADVPQKIAELWQREFSDKNAVERQASAILASAQSVAPRLLSEVRALNTRANVNLAVGSAISLIGLAILTWFVWITSNELSSHVDAIDVALRFGVRLTLAVFIQVFAYFFLRLYRYNIFETKYFQNEATNAEFRLLALMTAMKQNDQKLIDKVATELVRTERNFVLKKGESTVALQRDIIEKQSDEMFVNAVEAVMVRREKAKKD